MVEVGIAIIVVGVVAVVVGVSAVCLVVGVYTCTYMYHGFVGSIVGWAWRRWYI